MGATYLFLLTCFLMPLHGKEVVKDVTVRLVEERVNGRLFIHRVDMLDGHRKEQWVVEGELVSEFAYLDAISQAEAQEIRRRRQEELDHERAAFEYKMRLRRIGCKRLLQMNLHEIEQEIRPLHDVRLQRFLAFDVTSLSEEHYHKLIHSLLPQARAMVTGAEDELDVQKVEQLIGQLEGVAMRLRSLYHDTVQAAMRSSDDTLLLKELLGRTLDA